MLSSYNRYRGTERITDVYTRSPGVMMDAATYEPTTACRRNFGRNCGGTSPSVGSSMMTMGRSNTAPMASTSVLTNPKYSCTVIISSNARSAKLNRNRSVMGSTRYHASAAPHTNRNTAPTMTGTTTFFSWRYSAGARNNQTLETMTGRARAPPPHPAG